jgi:hypothetical protein
LNISMGFTKSVTGSTTFGSFMTQTFGHLILALWLVNGAPGIARSFIQKDRPRKMIRQVRLRIRTGRRSNQSMKPTAPFGNKSSVFATTPCRGLSLSR